MTNLVKFSVATLAAVLALSAKADVPVFGNSATSGTAFSIVDYSGQSLSGAAVEFTPDGNFDLSSVTLWLSGYTGQYGQSINASLWNSYNNAPDAPLINFTSPTANSGSEAAFTFSNPSANPYNDPSGSLVLQADTAYWLVVTAQGRAGAYMEAASWADGSTPSGVATFDGADSYNVSSASFSASSAVPAFSINDGNVAIVQPAPEPGVCALLVIPALLIAGRKLQQRRQALRLCRVRAVGSGGRRVGVKK